MVVEYDLIACSDSRGTYSSNLRWYFAWSLLSVDVIAYDVDLWRMNTTILGFVSIPKSITLESLVKSPDSRDTTNMASSSPPGPKDDGDARQTTEEDPLLPCHHVRTASVILRSGDRVRRKVSLMSIFDENPFEEDECQTSLRNPGGTASTAYSLIAPSLADRDIQPCESTRLEKFRVWLHSEGLKR